MKPFVSILSHKIQGLMSGKAENEDNVMSPWGWSEKKNPPGALKRIPEPQQ